MPGENPWRTLRSRPDITLLWKRLPEGMGGQWSGNTITLDRRLGRVELRCVLMHELIHAERRIGWPFATAATMEVEERMVRTAAALRLVPLEELYPMVCGLEGIEHVTLAVVADHFDVTPQVAHTALQVLNRRLLDGERARAARRDDDGLTRKAG